jgi:hypothetical protein
MRPKDSGESPQTRGLREDFRYYKGKLGGLSLQDLDPEQLHLVQEFTSGRRDPPENILRENQTQHDLREGIQEMEDLLDSCR